MLLVVEESKKKGFVQVLVAGGAKVTEGNKTLVGINPVNSHSHLCFIQISIITCILKNTIIHGLY